MSIIVASNRLPLYLEKEGNTWRTKESVSGLVSAVKTLNPKVWIGLTGCNAEISEECDSQISGWQKEGYGAINLCDDKLLHNFDDYIANLWSVFHNQIGQIDFTTKGWDAYKEVNRNIAKRILMYHYKEDDVILLQDFQLCLVAKYLRETVKDIKINFFLHIPFPSLDIFRTIPNGKELISSLLSCDKIQFHTMKDSDNFWQVLDYYNPHSFESDGFPSIEVNPIGVDIKRIEENVNSETAKIFAGKVRDAYPTPDKIILSVGRLDFTKGLEQMLKSFEYILKNTDERPFLYLVAVMTRKGSIYQQLIKKIDQMVAKINGIYSTPGYIPIFYTNNGLSAQELAGLYSVSDLCWVNSISDGYNLVSSEYVVANPQGHLILSEFAGASEDFRGDFICNPYDITKTAGNVLTGLTRGNCGSLRGKVRDISKWTEKLI